MLNHTKPMAVNFSSHYINCKTKCHRQFQTQISTSNKIRCSRRSFMAALKSLVAILLFLPLLTYNVHAHRPVIDDVTKNGAKHGGVMSQCHENQPKLDPRSGVGSVVEIGGLKCYVSGPSDSKTAVLLASDVFGYEVPNLRKIADKAAAAGFFAVVPDFFFGDPYVPKNPKMPINVWKARHDPVKAFENSKPVIKALKENGVEAIGAAGFCFGAKVTVELAKSGLIQAGVFLHPTEVTEDDIKNVKAPLAILGAEKDNLTPPAVIEKFEEILLSKPEIDSFVKIFPGVEHGWTTRYNSTDEFAVKSAEEAHEDMLNWFIEYISVPTL